MAMHDVLAKWKSAPRAKSSSDWVQRVTAARGSAPPAELLALMTMMEKQALRPIGDFEFETARGEALHELPGFVFAIEKDQFDPFPRTGRYLVFLDSVVIGEEKGKTWLAHPVDGRVDLISIDSAEGTALTAGPLAEGLQSLEASKKPPKATRPFEPYRRAEWIFELLEDSSHFDQERFARVFARSEHPPAKEFPGAASSATELMYWLFRSRFLDEADLFAKVWAVAAKSKVAMVKDAAASLKKKKPELGFAMPLEEILGAVEKARENEPRGKGRSKKTLSVDIEGLATSAYADLLSRLRKGAKRAKPGQTVAALESSFGCPLPGELKALVAAMDARKATEATEWGWRISIDSPRDDFEEAIEAHQEEAENSTLSLLPLFGNLVGVGSATDGDLFFAHVNPEDEVRAEVWWYDHEQGTVYGPPEADSLATLSLLSQLADKVSNGGDADGLEPVVKQLTGKSPMVAHFREISDAVARGVDFAAAYRARSQVDRYLSRATWLFRLFRDGSFDTARVKKALSAEKDCALPDAQSIHFAPEALYWLARSFWLNKEKDLGALIALAKKSRAPIVRSAAKTFAALQEGRAKLGVLEDVHAIRKKLVAAVGKAS